VLKDRLAHRLLDEGVERLADGLLGVLRAELLDEARLVVIERALALVLASARNSSTLPAR
jgi:hypothetical protein